MKKILRLLQEGWFAFRFFKNFPVYYFERFGFLPKKQVTLLSRGGIHFRIQTHTTDIRVVNEIWNLSIYDPLLRFVKPNATVIDIGANIGAFSIRAAKYAAHVNVISYEPFPDNYKLLRENVRLNGIADQIITHNAAVAGHKGEIKFYSQEGDTGGGSIYPHGSPQAMATMSVSAVTLEDVFRDNKVDFCEFLKIDCEGAEVEILTAAPPSLWQKIQSMTIEWHEDVASMNKKSFVALIQGHGFKVQEAQDDRTIYAWREEK